MKINHDLLHIVLQINRSTISYWNPRQKTVGQPHVIRGAMHSGKKKWRSALWLNAMHSGKKVMNSRILTPF